MGRKNELVTKHFTAPDGSKVSREVELFTWEKLDKVSALKDLVKSH
jgi:S-adenosylmethionine synthetase